MARLLSALRKNKCKLGNFTISNVCELRTCLMSSAIFVHLSPVYLRLSFSFPCPRVQSAVTWYLPGLRFENSQLLLESFNSIVYLRKRLSHDGHNQDASTRQGLLLLQFTGTSDFCNSRFVQFCNLFCKHFIWQMLVHLEYRMSTIFPVCPSNNLLVLVINKQYLACVHPCTGRK